MQLKVQLEALRKCLLPPTFTDTGVYDAQDEVSMRAVAYRVLVHAEIEAYFEDRALEVVRDARGAWDQGFVSRVALCLIAFSGKQMSAPPETLQAPNENKRKSWPELVDVGEKFVPVASEFHRFVRNENHGIKEKNLLSLLLPIGLDYRKFDPAFLADMESFGALRGLAAHTSGRASVTQGVDPESELRRVLALLPGIETLDAEIDLLFSVPEELGNAVVTGARA